MDWHLIPSCERTPCAGIEEIGDPHSRIAFCMLTIDRLPSVCLGALLVGGALLAVCPTLAHPASPMEDRLGGSLTPWTVGADTSDAPSFEPYATNRSLLYHVLATPAYILHGVTRPIGWGVRFVEQRYPGIFKPELRIRGIRPLVELGGPTGFLAGVALFDRQLLGGTDRGRLEILYGGPDTYEGKVLYAIPNAFGPQTNLEGVVNVFSDPRNEFYIGGNESDIDTSEAFFSRWQVDATLGLRASSPNDVLSGGVDVLYEHVDATRGEGTEGDRIEALSPPGLGTVDLLTSRLLLGLNLTRGRPRTYWGTEMLLQLDYSHDLNAERFRYGRYVAEIRQYLPVGIFPKTRRLALRARLEQVEPLFEGSAVPFYQLPDLGGRRMLRGFRAGRFQDAGSLLLTAEYRYPIWKNLDAVVLVDAGQVFPELSAMSADRFRWSYGGGIHLLSRKGISFRFEVAGSTEGVRTILTVDPSFQRVVR